MEALRRVGGETDGDAERDAAAGAGELHEEAQALALDPLHDDEEHAVLFAEVEDLGDVGVMDLGRELGFGEEHLLELVVVRERRQHRFDGDELLEAARALHPRCPDHGHSAARHGQEELVAAERMARANIAERSHRNLRLADVSAKLKRPDSASAKARAMASHVWEPSDGRRSVGLDAS